MLFTEKEIWSLYKSA